MGGMRALLQGLCPLSRRGRGPSKEVSYSLHFDARNASPLREKVSIGKQFNTSEMLAPTTTWVEGCGS